MTSIVLEGRVDYLMRTQKYLSHTLRSGEQERGITRDRGKYLVRKMKKYKGMVREARERECNGSSKDVIWISKKIADLGKNMEREQDEAGMSGSAFVSTEAEICRITSNTERIRD